GAGTPRGDRAGQRPALAPARGPEAFPPHHLRRCRGDGPAAVGVPAAEGAPAAGPHERGADPQSGLFRPGRACGRLAGRGTRGGGRSGRLDLWRWAGVHRGPAAGRPAGGHRDRPGSGRRHLRPADRPAVAGGAHRPVAARRRRVELPDLDLPEVVRRVPQHGPTTLPERQKKIRALTGMGLVGLLCLLLVVGAATVGPWRVNPVWEVNLPEPENTPTPTATATPTVG